MRNKLLLYVTSSFDSIGINVQEDSITIKVWRYVFICVMILLSNISLITLSITNRNNFNKFVLPAPYTAAATTLIGGLLITYIHRKTIGQMLHHLDTNLYSYPDEHLIENKYKWYLQENTIFAFIKISMYGQIFTLAMLSLPALIELIYYRRINTFLFPLWCPWKVDNLQKELFAYVFQIAQCSCGVAYSHVITIFIIIVIVEFVKQYERLYVAVSSLTSRTSIPDGDQRKRDRYEEVMRQNIIHCVRHHQMIYKSFQCFKIWFTVYFSFELAVCLLTFAFALYVLMNGSNLAEVLNCFAAFFFIWCNFLTKCLISELFTYLNDHLAETIYLQIEWFRSNQTNRRLHLVFHQLAIKPQQLNGLSVFEANRTTLSRIIRFIYSIFNVLNFSRK